MTAKYKLELLKEARLRRGLGFSDIGKGIGVSARTVRRVENGETSKPDTVWRIAQYLGVNMDRLVTVRRKR